MKEQNINSFDDIIHSIKDRLSEISNNKKNFDKNIDDLKEKYDVENKNLFKRLKKDLDKVQDLYFDLSENNGNEKFDKEFVSKLIFSIKNGIETEDKTLVELLDENFGWIPDEKSTSLEPLYVRIYIKKGKIIIEKVNGKEKKDSI